MNNIEYLQNYQQQLDQMFEQALAKVAKTYADAVETLVTNHWLETERLSILINDLEKGC